MADSSAGHQAPNFSVSSGNSNDSFNSNTNAKYRELIRQNHFKVFRRDLMQLFGYIYSTSPPFTLVQNIMTIIRIMQFLLPCLCPSYFNFWIRGTIEQITMNVLSVFYYILPPTTSDVSARVLLYIYIVVQLIVLIVIFSSSFYFKKYAKLPAIVPPMLAFYGFTLGHIFHPIVVYLDAEGLSVLISGKYTKYFSVSEFICLFVISAVLMLIHFWITLSVTSQTLVFRPTSLMTATSPPQTFIFLSTIFVNFFLGIGSRMNKTGQIVFLSLTLVIYAATSFSAFTSGGFIFNYITNLVLSASITASCFIFVVLICVIVGKTGELMFFFGFIILYVLVTIVNFFILRKVNFSRIHLLDQVYEDDTKFDSLIKSPNHFLNLAICSMNCAHPICLELKLFTLAVGKWQREPIIWYIFAKFIAIYPEETQKLSWIYHNVTLLKLSGSAVRCIKEQTLSISRQREPNLSAELKSKLSVISKQLQSTKHKLRHVWDVVIQGNISEVETSTKRALKAIDQIDADFKHLFRQFPNNRFVTRTYARFLLEITADHTLSNQMVEKTRLLQRGITVNSDQTHELGISIFRNLPEHIQSQRENQNPTCTESTAQSYNPDSIDQEDDFRVDSDQILTLKHRIEELTIPAILGGKLLNIMFLLFFFIVPCIAGLIYFDVFLEILQKPLHFLSSLSLLRTYSYQIIGFSVRYIGENLSVYNVFPSEKEAPPATFGKTWDTKEQLRYIVSTTTDAIQEFGSFRKFEQGNRYIQKAQDLIFSNTVSYRYYTTPTNSTRTMLSIQAAVMDYAIQQNALLADTAVSPSILNTSTVLNTINNAANVSSNINDALQYLIEFVNENYENAKYISNIVLIVLILFEIITFFLATYLQLRWIRSNKQETYQCLLSLPKNTVSALSENLRLLKKENQDENTPNSSANPEMNKQEENILKIFNSGSSTEVPLSDMFLLIFGTLIIVGLSIGCIVIFVYLVTKESQILKESAPHLNYLMGAYTMMLSALDCLNILLFSFTQYPIIGWDPPYAIERMKTRLNQSRNFYHLASYGGSSSEQTPLKGFSQGVSNAQSKIKCNADSKVPGNFQEVVSCYPADMAFILIEPVIVYGIMPYEQGMVAGIDSKDMTYTTLWHEMISPLYDAFFFPMHFMIIPTIVEQLKEVKKGTIPAIVAMMVIAIAIEVILFVQLVLIGQHIRSVLNLLLHCPPDIVLSTPKIMKLLSGDFSTQKADTMNRDSEFFDSVFISLPDAIMYANSEMVVQAANISCQRIFGDMNFVGTSIKEFFNSSKFSGRIDILFTSANSNPVEPIIYRKDENTELHLEASAMYASGKFVMSCRDVTQAFRYNTLIREERAKSDQLLATILPPSLVKRVQEGEKNISFAVQSASILFSDIVEFTPWCGSLPAATVMSTLNILFKRFDAILSLKPTMTKIKCIGDCYMAAGGIFAEINQPTEHAKEVVSFGIESIQAINEINKEIGEKLKIRVGVNTGGPIVAGVLGIGKPTFEILGPAINLAQQMEHHGVPMTVHITRAVYELIYGDTFTIRERGSVEVKGGSVITYLVTQKN